MAAYFISDIHILDRNDANLKKLASLLQDIRKDASHLFLLGDIFDLWVGGSEYFAREFAPAIEQIRGMGDDGVEIHYIEGNHDFHLKDFWEKKLGAKIYGDSHELKLFGKKVRIEHGDFINPDDKLYFRWRWFMRSPFIKYPAKVAPGWFTAWIGNNLSAISRKKSREHAPRIRDEIIEKFKVFSHKRAEEFDFDLMITGHVHVQQDLSFEAGGKPRRSVNLGYWDKPKVFKLSDDFADFIYQ